MRSILVVGQALLVVIASAGNLKAQVAPISVSGWVDDMVINNPTPHNTQVTGTMDGGLSTPEGWTWVEAGDYTNVDGNTQTFLGLVPGSHASLTGNGVFEFQAFDGLNSLGLDNLRPTGTLTLDTPAAYTSIALYGASTYGAKDIDVTFNFSDSSSTTVQINQSGLGSDWFNVSSVAYAVGGRASNKGEEGYTRLFYQESQDLGIGESFFTLSPADQGKLLTSVEITNLSGDRVSILAISGQQVPEPSALALLGAAGLASHVSRRRR